MRKWSKKTITTLTAGVTAAALISVGVLTPWYNVTAKDTLQGIQDIVSSNTREAPYTILEVVPDEALTTKGSDEIRQSMGMIGYYIGGQEPVILERDLAQFSSTQERKAFVDRLFNYSYDETIVDSMPGVLADITEKVESDGNTSDNKPLFFREYIESYESDWTREELEEKLNNGSLKQIVYPAPDTRYEKVPDALMEEAANSGEGSYIMLYEASEQDDPAVKFFTEESDNDIIQSAGTDSQGEPIGQFDPHFAYAGTDETESEKYAAVFAPVKGTYLDRGYLPVIDTQTEITSATMWTAKLNGKQVYEALTDEDGNIYLEYKGYITGAADKVIQIVSPQSNSLYSNMLTMEGLPAAVSPSVTPTSGEDEEEENPEQGSSTPTGTALQTPAASEEASQPGEESPSAAPVPTREPDSEPQETTEPEPDSEQEATTEPEATGKPQETDEPESGETENLPEEGSFTELVAENGNSDVTETPKPLQTAKKTAEPEGTTAPQGTAEPAETTAPQGTAEPEGTTAPQGTAEPEGTTATQGTAEPEGTTAPQGTAEPEGTTAPQGTADPSGEPSASPSTSPEENSLLSLQRNTYATDLSAGTYYIVTFEYWEQDAEDTEKPAYFYRVSNYQKQLQNGSGAAGSTGTAAIFEYALDTEEPLVPNPLGKGLVTVDAAEANRAALAAENPEKPHIVYGFSRGNGRYNLATEGERTYDQTYFLKDINVYFEGGFYNNEWLKRKVFDRESGEQCEQLYIEVHTVTADQVTQNDVANADFFYIANPGGEWLAYGDCLGQTQEGQPLTQYAKYGESTLEGETTTVHDLEAARVLQIIGQVAEQKKPVFFEASLIREALAATDTAAVSNVHRLAKLLTLSDLDGFYGAHADLTVEAEISEALLSGFLDGTLLENVEDALDQGAEAGTLHFVNENKYCFDLCKEHLEDEPAENKLPIINTVFEGEFEESLVEDYFMEVVEDIRNENLYRETDGGREPLDDTVSEATTIRYIINFAGKKTQAVKEQIRVLEIEPCAAYDLSVKIEYTQDTEDPEKQIRKDVLMCDGDVIVEQTGSSILLTKMTTAELIGKNTDLNANYDLIYIGLNTDLMNTKNQKTVYNDENMNGLVYTNVGDLIYARPVLGGLLDRDYVDGNRQNLLIDGAGLYRFSGNDINGETREKLEDFVRAGYPVLVADDMLVEDEKNGRRRPNEEVIDNSSYMYEFLANVTGPNRGVFPNAQKDLMNVLSIEDITENLFAWYLNLSKPVITLSGDAATAQETAYKLYKSADGFYHLTFKFSLTNASAADQSSTFDCGLYIDINADGKFSKTKEKVNDITITDESGNLQGTEDGRYFLATGKEYTVSKTISDEYVGIIPWSIEVAQNGNTSRRASQAGYYLINKTQKERINILQICSAGDNNLNLQEKMKDGNSLFKKYIEDVKDFDVNITSISSDVYKTMYDADHGILDQYDMLIIGFADCYQEADNSTGAMTAISKYIDSGRSVLFTHDTTSFVNVEWDKFSQISNRDSAEYWGYSFNTLIRDQVGLDRYGVLGNRENKETAYKPGSSRKEEVPEIQGFTYGTLSRYSVASANSYQSPWKNIDTGKAQYEPMFISQVNKGQITMYPYKIDETISVAKTHQQYYQIDLNADDDEDGESDIVVWYTLSGKTAYTGDEAVDGNRANNRDAYFKSPNDVRNNYYIFNKGNVTYSGVGHSNIDKDGNDNEVKLFVNTMVAAYQSGLRAPKISILADKEYNSRKINNIYLSYDTALKEYRHENDGEAEALYEGIVETTHDIYFVAEDVNLLEGDRRLSVRYYVEDNESADTFEVNGNEIHARELTAACPLSVAQTGEAADHTDIEGSRVYHFAVTTDQLKMENKNTVKIYVVVTAAIADREGEQEQQEISSAATVSMVRTQMFNLD